MECQIVGEDLVDNCLTVLLINEELTQRGVKHLLHDLVNKLKLVTSDLVCTRPLCILVAVYHGDNSFHHLSIILHNVFSSQEAEFFHVKQLFVHLITGSTKGLEVVPVGLYVLPVFRLQDC
jgi:hypothetical protein